MPRVLNKKIHGVPEGAVYVGRPSKWGNPFVIGKDGNREEVLDLYHRWMLEQIRYNTEFYQSIHKELRGKDLVCWCTPEPCHADDLLFLANSRDYDEVREREEKS